MADVLCFDFDDTIVMDNLTRAVLREFADPAWREAESRYQQGELSVEQFNMAALDLVPVSVSNDDLRAFARAHARVRPGLRELADWAHWNGWQVVVVSNGFDFCVEPVLADLGLDRVARHCGRTRRAYRWRARYDSPRGIEVAEGFKVGYAAALRGAGDFVGYVGDGASDVPAARLAAVVFARSTLLEALTGEHPRLYPFETFDDVQNVLENESERWPRPTLD